MEGIPFGNKGVPPEHFFSRWIAASVVIEKTTRPAGRVIWHNWVPSWFGCKDAGWDIRARAYGLWPKHRAPSIFHGCANPLLYTLRQWECCLFIHTLLYRLIFFSARAHCLSWHSVITDLNNLDFIFFGSSVVLPSGSGSSLIVL